jgi:hypothetical protein
MPVSGSKTSRIYLRIRQLAPVRAVVAGGDDPGHLKSIEGASIGEYPSSMHKHLRRLERVWIDDPIYFITSCTYNRTTNLACENAAPILVNEWQSARGRHGWAIGRYVVMPNHVHFFCAPDRDAKPLSVFIGFWKE